MNGAVTSPMLGVEMQVGLVVEVSQDRTIVVELSYANGAARRCTAHTLVPIDPNMVGWIVEHTLLDEDGNVTRSARSLGVSRRVLRKVRDEARAPSSGRER